MVTRKECRELGALQKSCLAVLGDVSNREFGHGGAGGDHFNVDRVPRRKQEMCPDQWFQQGAMRGSSRRVVELHYEGHGGPYMGFPKRQSQPKEFKLRMSRPSSGDSGPDLASLQKMNQTRERPKAEE